jgi:hypothetical protein
MSSSPSRIAREPCMPYLEPAICWRSGISAGNCEPPQYGRALLPLSPRPPGGSQNVPERPRFLRAADASPRATRTGSQLGVLYEHRIGCVGVLKEWLVRSLAAALSRGAAKITLRDLAAHALTISRCEKMLAEVTEGAARMTESNGARSRIRLSLGLRGICQANGTPREIQSESACACDQWNYLSAGK